jgi:SAM-dependent methyltransferase
MHWNSKYMYERHGAPRITAGARVLEIGPDKFPISTTQEVSAASVACWDTVDFDRSNEPSADLTYVMEDSYTFPIPDESYDVVLAANVIEHVPKPWKWLPNVARLVRPGGLVITVVPVSWPFHEAPLDCWRMYPDGLRALYEDSGLEVLVAEWGSIELENWARKFPRWKYQMQLLSGPLLWLTWKSHYRWRNAGAYDTIVVGHKPGG